MHLPANSKPDDDDRPPMPRFRSEPPDRLQFQGDKGTGESVIRIIDPTDRFVFEHEAGGDIYLLDTEPQHGGGGVMAPARQAIAWHGTVRPVDRDPAEPTAAMAVPLKVFASIGADDAVPIANIATPFPLGADTHVWLSVAITAFEPTAASVETGAGAYAPMIFPETGTQSSLNIPVGCVVTGRLPAGQLGFDFLIKIPGESQPQPHHFRQTLFMHALLVSPRCVSGRPIVAAEPFSPGVITRTPAATT